MLFFFQFSVYAWATTLDLQAFCLPHFSQCYMYITCLERAVLSFYGSIIHDIDKTRRAAHFCLQKVRIVIFTIGVEPPKALNELPEGCILIKDKTTKLVSSCPFRGTKGKTTLEDCVGSLTQYNANTINYSPSRQECNMKACTDENDAKTNLGRYGSAEFDVYYCREY